MTGAGAAVTGRLSSAVGSRLGLLGNRVSGALSRPGSAIIGRGEAEPDDCRTRHRLRLILPRPVAITLKRGWELLDYLFPGLSVTSGYKERRLFEAKAGKGGIILSIRYPLKWSKITRPDLRWSHVTATVDDTKIDGIWDGRPGPYWFPLKPGFVRVHLTGRITGPTPLVRARVRVTGEGPTVVRLFPGVRTGLGFRRQILGRLEVELLDREGALAISAGLDEAGMPHLCRVIVDDGRPPTYQDGSASDLLIEERVLRADRER